MEQKEVLNKLKDFTNKDDIVDTDKEISLKTFIDVTRLLVGKIYTNTSFDREFNNITKNMKGYHKYLSLFDRKNILESITFNSVEDYVEVIFNFIVKDLKGNWSNTLILNKAYKDSNLFFEGNVSKFNDVEKDIVLSEYDSIFAKTHEIEKLHHRVNKYATKIALVSSREEFLEAIKLNFIKEDELFKYSIIIDENGIKTSLKLKDGLLDKKEEKDSVEKLINDSSKSLIKKIKVDVNDLPLYYQKEVIRELKKKPKKKLIK